MCISLGDTACLRFSEYVKDKEGYIDLLCDTF